MISLFRPHSKEKEMEGSALKKTEHFLRGQDSTLQRLIHNLLKRLFLYHHVGFTFLIFSTILLLHLLPRKVEIFDRKKQSLNVP